MANRLNGWQRLWVLLSVPFVVGGLIISAYGLRQMDTSDIWGGIAVAVTGPMFMYAFGWGIAWVIRGFKGK